MQKVSGVQTLNKAFKKHWLYIPHVDDEKLYCQMKERCMVSLRIAKSINYFFLFYIISSQYILRMESTTVESFSFQFYNCVFRFYNRRSLFLFINYTSNCDLKERYLRSKINIIVIWLFYLESFPRFWKCMILYIMRCSFLISTWLSRTFANLL